MKLWNLINPSDAVTFRAPDLQIAFIVSVTLSDGKYPAVEILENGERGLSTPLLLYNQPELRIAADEFCMENWNLPYEQVEATVIRDRYIDLCKAFVSFIYGDPEDRKLIEELLAALPDDDARELRLAEWNESRRTSTTDIIGQALSMAKTIKEIRDEEERHAETKKAHA